MILELAAGYGAVRAISDLIGWMGRRPAPAQQQGRELVPVDGRHDLYRDPSTGRFQRGMDAPEMQPVYSGGPSQVTDFEIIMRGQTREYR